MIDLKNELKFYLPIDIENIVKMNSNISEDIKNSILLYNNALENLRMGSEDIAMIELRKTISLNPEFHEAINLLGVCYYYLKDYDKAEEMFEKVIKAENNGVKALNYLRIIRKDETTDASQVDGQVKMGRARKKTVKPKEKRERETEISRVIRISHEAGVSGVREHDMGMKEKKSDTVRLNEFSRSARRKTGRKQELIKYLIGIVIGLIIAFSIGIPGKSNQNKDSSNNSNIGNKGTTVTENEEIAEYQKKYKQLSSEYEKLKEDYEVAKIDRDYYKAVIKLYEADDFYKARKYEEAADIMVLVKNVEFSGAEKEKYDKLFNEIMPRASDIVYSQAYNLFQGRNFKESVNKYLKITEYYDNYTKMDIVLYYAGKCYLELGDNEKAKAMFLKTIEKYPDSEYAKYSKSRLNSITGSSGSE